MISSKAFAVVEAVDSPKGTVLVRYKIVERCEPDPEERRLADMEFEDHLKKMDEETRENFKMQLAASKAVHFADKAPYNVEDKIVICQSHEEIAAAIKEAKEAYDERKKLQKSGTHLNMDYGAVLG